MCLNFLSWLISCISIAIVTAVTAVVCLRKKVNQNCSVKVVKIIALSFLQKVDNRKLQNTAILGINNYKIMVSFLV